MVQFIWFPSIYGNMNALFAVYKQQKICSVYGDGAMTEIWFQVFC